MKKRLLAAVLCLAMLITCVPSFAFQAQASELPVITCNGSAQSAVSFPRNERITLTAEGGSWYRWQIKVNDSLWVNISGETGETLDVSYAMIANLCQGDTAYLRVAADGERFSDPVAVTAGEAKIEAAEDTSDGGSYVIQDAPTAILQDTTSETTAPTEAATEGSSAADVEAAEAAYAEAAAAYELAAEDLAAKQAAYEAATAKRADAEAAVQASAVVTTIPAEYTTDENGETVEVTPESTTVTYDEALEVAAEAAIAEEAAAREARDAAQAVLTQAEANKAAAEAALNAAKAAAEATSVAGAPSSNYGLRSSSNYNLSNEPAAQSDDDTSDSGQNSLSNYTITINFQFEDGSLVAQPTIMTVGGGASGSATVSLPVVQGYAPYENGAPLTGSSITVTYSNISADDTRTIVYKPAEVNYTVKHFQQNIYDDGYTEVTADRETCTGLTNSDATATAKTYEGFYKLIFETPKIAADGSTVVEIYYDRYYYLMNFSLDGGHGVEPIYARYDTPISGVDTPVKAGYIFQYWTLGSVQATIPSNMPAENRIYTAVWSESNSSFTVVYWLENADDDNYSVFGTATVEANTGNTVDGNNYKDYDDYITTDANFQAVEDFIYFNHADGEVTVAGDKSTTVNVYYSRNEYTLKFYYAISRTTQTNTTPTYYVIGGSTYFFGASGTSTTNSIDNLTNYYMDGGEQVSQRGQVDEIPTLNSTGSARNYTTGFDTASKKSGNTTYNYNYYYISFTAKYGADISNLWPCDVFNSVTRLNKNNTNGWTGTEAFVSAWNGEHHVYYSQHNGNQTIKGNYNQLDSQLLWDYSNFGAYAEKNEDVDTGEDVYTVDFLCFWENGANVDWSVPSLFRYQIWVPVLEGQDTTGLTTTTYNGVIYYLRNTYDTVDDSDVDHQTAPAITGLTYVGYEGHKITNPDQDLYKDAYEVNFYYSRNEYNLTFKNGGETDKTVTALFEADISGKYYVPELPTDVYEAGAYEFDGWYTSDTCEPGTKFTFTDSTMPANDLVLYANWVPVNHTVEFYLDFAAYEAGNKLYSDLTVPHNSFANPKPATPTNGKYTFVGWFYMDGNTEKAFDFANMPVTKDLKVYGKWTYDGLKQYFVYYKYENENGEEIEIAAPATGSGLGGSTKTVYPKGGDALHADYQEGYFPLLRSHSLYLDINVENLAYTFWYVKKDAVPYTVYYVTDTQNADNSLEPVIIDGQTYYKVAQTKTVSDNRKAIVTEQFVPVSGYMPDEYQKTLIVSGANDAVNEIIFFYTVDNDHAYYTVTHYTEDIEKDANGNIQWSVYGDVIANRGDINGDYSTGPIAIPGFTYDEDNPNNVTSGTLTADGLELKLYYTRNSYPYEVRYLEKDTNKQLHAPKTDTDLYETVLTVEAIDIENYTAVAPTTQPLTIQIEDGTTAVKNVITFYYTENEATINYQVVGPTTGCGSVSPTSETLKVLTGTAQGSTATASSNTYKFVGWYEDAACTEEKKLSTDAHYTPTKADGAAWIDGTTYYAKFEYNLTTLTITKSGALDENDGFIFDVTGNGESFTVSVKGNGSVTIAGVTVGATYTITERSDWAWRYSVPGSQSIKLVADGSKNTVTVTNSGGKQYLLDGSAYAHNIDETKPAGDN